MNRRQGFKSLIAVTVATLTVSGYAGTLKLPAFAVAQGIQSSVFADVSLTHKIPTASFAPFTLNTLLGFAPGITGSATFTASINQGVSVDVALAEMVYNMGYTPDSNQETTYLNKLVGVYVAAYDDQTNPSVTAADVAAELSNFRNTVPVQGPAPTSNSITTYLKLGDSGDQVRILQEFLIAEGFLSLPHGVTGYFGPMTKAAVMSYQSANLDRIKQASLLESNPQMGFVGDATSAVINEDLQPNPQPNTQSNGVQDEVTTNKTGAIAAALESLAITGLQPSQTFNVVNTGGMTALSNTTNGQDHLFIENNIPSSATNPVNVNVQAVTSTGGALNSDRLASHRSHSLGHA